MVQSQDEAADWDCQLVLLLPLSQNPQHLHTYSCICKQMCRRVGFRISPYCAETSVSAEGRALAAKWHEGLSAIDLDIRLDVCRAPHWLVDAAVPGLKAEPETGGGGGARSAAETSSPAFRHIFNCTITHAVGDWGTFRSQLYRCRTGTAQV